MALSFGHWTRYFLPLTVFLVLILINALFLYCESFYLRLTLGLMILSRSICSRLRILAASSESLASAATN